MLLVKWPREQPVKKWGAITPFSGNKLSPIFLSGNVVKVSSTTWLKGNFRTLIGLVSPTLILISPIFTFSLHLSTYKYPHTSLLHTIPKSIFMTLLYKFLFFLTFSCIFSISFLHHPYILSSYRDIY